MPLPIYRLRRWLLVTAVMFTSVVVGMYFYARMRVRNVLKEVPNKIGIDIKQTATGFQFSKSDGGRTLFTIQATDLKQFKLNGRAELHNVSIVLYGKDSSRFDQISGEDFAYDPKSGDITANGEVQIDLEANPTGLTGPDQAMPKELKNPIHLKTRDLVFNRETGNAWTNARVEFRTPQASWSSMSCGRLSSSIRESSGVRTRSRRREPRSSWDRTTMSSERWPRAMSTRKLRLRKPAQRRERKAQTRLVRERLVRRQAASKLRECTPA